jgi:hypothetical protein
MGDKIRGTIAILVGAFGLFRSYQIFEDGIRGWTPWLMLAAGMILILQGGLRLRHRPADPVIELMK